MHTGSTRATRSTFTARGARGHDALLQDLAHTAGLRLDDVHIRRDAGAAALCGAAHALALTIEDRVFVHPAAARLPAAAYRELVAHEIVHVLQHRRAVRLGRRPTAALSDDADASEREARVLAPRLAAGEAIAVCALPTAHVQRKTMDNLKGLLGSSVYNEVAVSIRPLQGDEREHAINFNYALADVYQDLEEYVAAAGVKEGTLDSIARYFVQSKLSKNAKLLDQNVKTVTAWVAEIKTACKGTGMSKGDVGLLLLAAARRNWQASQLRKIIQESAGSIGVGDATYSRIARWMYNFAFHHRGEIALADMRFNADKPLSVPRPAGGPRTVMLFQNRVKHIVSGHTFRYYVLDDEQIENLARAHDGVQSFYPVHYTDAQVAADVESALLNAPEVGGKLAASNGGFFNVATPYHLRLSLAYSTNGVARLSTGFPGPAIAQPNTHRIPEKILESIYSLMAQGLGLQTLKQARKGTGGP